MMGSHTNNPTSHRAKPYALMLLLAFAAAILGVMVLHKLRETRIFSILVKQKDQELLALHLLFQREKEFNKEARNKIEEMKTKVYSLRSQKLDQDRRFSEMESTISTLRDERKVIESSLQEKTKEIKIGVMKNSSIENLKMNLTSNSTENGESRGLGDGEFTEKKTNETMTADQSEGLKGTTYHRGGRRRHSKGKRLKDSVLRNRRLGQSLYYLRNDNVSEAKENATMEKLAVSDKDNVNIRNGEKSDEMSSKIVEDSQASGKPENNEEKESGKGDDEEDGVTQDAEEIDAQRFSGFDHEDEAEETEF